MSGEERERDPEMENAPAAMEAIRSLRETFWENPEAGHFRKNEKIVDPDEAEKRLQRFAPLLKKAFPETGNGVIESPLLEIPRMRTALQGRFAALSGAGKLPARLYLKCDHALPAAGSVKARGGIYEVLKFAEEVALREGLLFEGENTEKLLSEEARKVFSRYRVAVGSTGNLGLSIGIMSAVLGFSVTVHMSSDAREWKKKLLREKGVFVKEYAGDYQSAVASGRREAGADPFCHFVDDENSLDLFAGYATAGKRISRQLAEKGVRVDARHRLYVTIPCGVGGAPGGITYGLREIFGGDVFCFTAEPVHAPALIAGLASGKGSAVSIKELGIDGITAADGLAVGRPSPLVCRAMRNRLHGCFTVEDEKLFALLALLWETEGIFVEPSAAAGFAGLGYLERGSFPPPDGSSSAVVWATGGSFVPEEEREAYLARGKDALSRLKTE